MLREYIVVLKTYEDLESFYEDMETPGGNLYIPDRKVDLAHRRPISRSTHYYLTDEEAEQVKNDPRVLGVELNFKDRGLDCTPAWVQTSNSWNKSLVTSRSNKNWGLLRCIEGVQRPGWGRDGNPTNISATIKTTSSGKNVDVVVVDGPFDPSHPEFAKNPDGTGGTRVIEYDWFGNLNSVVTPFARSSKSNYQYGLYNNPSFLTEVNHGTHVAGTFAGNTQGWARDANIYHISPYSNDPNFAFPNAFPIWMDYIKAWHRTKPINPATGLRNPTITNHSYSFRAKFPISQITKVSFRGTILEGPFTESQLKQLGVYTSGLDVELLSPGSLTGSVTNDIIDLMNEGIIVVHASGNYNSLFLTDTTHPDYNNYVIRINPDIPGLELTYYYNQGSVFTVPQPNDIDTIVVGAIDSDAAETKAPYSSRGSRVDIFAPGSQIMSSVRSGGVTDLRNTLYFNSKYQGTSMASPQVAGVLACVAETWPRMSQKDARAYIISTAKVGQINDTNGTQIDTTSLLGAPNRYLAYKYERPLTGMVGPKVNQGVRPSAGQVWPRSKVFRYGS